MAKQVLLIQQVDGLGDEGDVVKVAEGYARNYLVPKKLATTVTKASEKQLTALRERRDARVTVETEANRVLSEKIATARVSIGVKVGEEGKLFGSVTTSDIAASLAEQGIEIDRHKIVIENPLKEEGDHTVIIKLPRGAECELKVTVAAEG